MKLTLICSRRSVTLSAIALTTVLCASSASALTITPTFAANINGDPNATDIKNTINMAIGFYQSNFNDPINVNITFQKGGGLGSSSTAFTNVSYVNLRNALVADASTPDDALALMFLPNQVNEPVSGGATVDLSTANARALGFNANPASDGTITLNTDICFLNHTGPQANRYDLYAVTCHEIDEVLGTISGVGAPPITTADLYRYNGAGARSYTTNTGVHAWFSIDGTTNIVEYNQFGRTGGDWGDWVVHNPGRVQDFAGSPNQIIDMSPFETRLLDVVGYNRNVVPEPATLAMLGLGALALVRRRRSK